MHLSKYPASSSPLSVSGITHAYRSGSKQTVVLKEVSFEVSNGEFAVIIGPSGCGKSTLLSLVSGLRSIQYGSIRLNNMELKGASVEQLQSYRQKIGIIFQSHKLFPFLNAAENVLIGSGASGHSRGLTDEKKVEELLSSVGLVGHSSKFPSQLSGGQCQRVSIARAIANTPTMIVADEPTASLDFKSSQSLVNLLIELIDYRNIPLLMATHDSRIIEMADKVIQLDDGIVS